MSDNQTDGTAYRVVVTREGASWLADVPQLPGTHTYARSLAGLDHEVREAIALAEDLAEDAEAGIELEYEIHTGDDAVDEAAARLRADRARVRACEQDLATRTEQLARQLRPAWSVRDVAALLGVSPQRISQLAPDEPGRVRPGRRSATAKA